MSKKPRRTTPVNERTAAHILRPTNPGRVIPKRSRGTTTWSSISRSGRNPAPIKGDERSRGYAAKDQKSPASSDFPVNADGKKIGKQDGTPVADTVCAERLNDDEARRGR